MTNEEIQKIAEHIDASTSQRMAIVMQEALAAASVAAAKEANAGALEAQRERQRVEQEAKVADFRRHFAASCYLKRLESGLKHGYVSTTVFATDATADADALIEALGAKR